MPFNIIAKDNQYNEIMIDFLFNLNRPGEIIEKVMIYDDFTVTQIICRVQSFVEIF